MDDLNGFDMGDMNMTNMPGDTFVGDSNDIFNSIFGESGDNSTEEDSGKQTNDAIMMAFRIFVCVVGVIGNAMVIFVIVMLKEYRKVTHWYVLQLAIADSLFLLTLPFKIAEDSAGEWQFSGGMCKAKEAVLFINYYSSILFLMVMSIDRYIAVCQGFSTTLQKLHTKRSAYTITFVVWIVSLALSSPIMAFSGKYGVDPHCKCQYEFPKYVGSVEEECRRSGLSEGKAFEDCIAFAQNEEICKKDDGEEWLKNLLQTNSSGGFPELGGSGLKPSFHGGTNAAPTNISTDDGLPTMFGSEFDTLFQGETNALPSNIGTDDGLPPMFGSEFETPFRGETNALPTNIGTNGHNPEFDAFYSGDINGTLPYDIATGPSYQPGCSYARNGSGWIAYLYFNFIVMFVLPFIIMSLCYCMIANRLRQGQARRRSTTNESSSGGTPSTSRKTVKTRRRSAATSKSDRDRMRVTCICLILVVLFLICWLPFHAIHLAKIKGIQGTTEFCVTVSAASAVVAYLNSAINPYIFNFIGTKFFRRLRSAVGTVRKSVKKRTSSLSSSGLTVRYHARKHSGTGTSSNSATATTKIYKGKSEVETSRSHSTHDEGHVREALVQK